MAKNYTAQEMREVASIYDDAGEDIVAAMLRQAADLMEREEKHEKKYEYKVLYYGCNGRVYDSMWHTENIQFARNTFAIYSGHKDAHIVRRPVGEWEVVK